MKSFFLFTTLLLLATVVSCDTDQCPLYDIDYYGNTLDYIRHIDGWEECGYLCHLTSGCNYWTWYPDYYDTCYLKTDNGGISNKDGIISGSKDCYN